MRTGRSTLILVGALGSLTSVLHAGESPVAQGVGDFVELCSAALLAPADLSSVAKARGLIEAGHVKPLAGMDATLYASADVQRGVTVTRQRFSDLSIASCQVSFSAPLSADELAELRSRLERQPALGRLEGELMEATPTMRVGTLKRPGNTPIVTINVTTASRATTLVMNRWDLEPGI